MTDAFLALTGKQTWAVIGGLAGLLLITTILVRAARRQKPALTDFGTDFFFWLGVMYLLLLLMVAVMYMGNFYGVKDRIPVILGGILPIGVPWFGAVGAVVISLAGLFGHNEPGRWDKSYSYWHLARPLFGAVLAIMAFFIYLLLINATGQTPPFATPGATTPASDLVVYYVVAFLVGYREESFRELVKRVTDLVFTKATRVDDLGHPDLAFEARGAKVEVVAPDPVAGGESTSLTVTVTNVGKAALTGPVLTVATNDAPAGGPFSKANDNLSGQGDLAPGDARTVDVVFAPPAGGSSPFGGQLSVASASLPTTVVVPLSGQRT
jgi:hypothetical protein